MDLLKEKIKAEALRLGFSFIGFSKPQQTPHFHQFDTWIKEGNHNGLDYLGKKYVLDARYQPAILLENVKTVITLGIAFCNLEEVQETVQQVKMEQGLLASYACLPDYHHLLKEKSKELITFIKGIQSPSIKSKFFVDSGPVMEKDFAYLSGLGWIGKNSLFISPAFGSFCLLGCLFVDFELQPDNRDETDLCENCEACIQACPTEAINNNRTIKASRCISFLTTNTKGVIPFELRQKIGNKVFGCDICQIVCPLNSTESNTVNQKKFGIKTIIVNRIDLLLELFFSEKEYIAKYSRTPVAKLSHVLFLRNLLIAIGNSGSIKFFDPLRNLLNNHPSPIIRATTAWALATIDSELSKDILLNTLKQETGVEVRNEIKKLIGLSR